MTTCPQPRTPKHNSGAHDFGVPSRQQRDLQEKTEVSWAAFPLLKERIDTALADSTIDDDSVVSQQNLALDVIYKFVCGVNTRLNENQGMEFLEACTLFDARPKFKAKNFCKRWAGIT